MSIFSRVTSTVHPCQFRAVLGGPALAAAVALALGACAPSMADRAGPPPAKTVSAPEAAAPLRLRVVDMTRFFVTPNQPAVLSWKINGSKTSQALSWNITNYWGHPVAAGTLSAVGPDNTINLPVRLPRGFYQLDFPTSGQKFGVVSIAAHHAPAGHFFSIDSAMSWLVNHPVDRQTVRVGMIKILRRSGIGMSRERLSWTQINPSPGVFSDNGVCQYGRLANDYFNNDVPMLQMFSDAPAWTHPYSDSPYPMNLLQTARSWAAIGSYFHTDWGALEIWNEPDGAGFPPDQLLPMVKAIAYSFQHEDIHVPLVGGVFGLSVPGFFQRDCALNGLLQQVNAISFHDYYSPTEIPFAVAAYRHWLADYGQPTMPLWITESGKPWAAGTARPHCGPDMTSALWITMKAVEARACGIARYFAFVYPFFVQGTDNFGMMGQEQTPLRSMAAYANCVAELSGWSYVGNLKTNDSAVLLAPVFARGERRTAVIYTGKANPHATLNLALHNISIRGIDGRTLHRSAKGSIPIPDGLVYLRGPASAFAGQVKTDTEAGRLYAISRQPPPKLQRHSPIILQLAEASDDWSAEAYVLSSASNTPVSLRVWNLADHAIIVKLTLRSDHLVAGHKPLLLHIQRQIPAHGYVLVQWKLGPLLENMGLGFLHYHYLVVTGQEVPASAQTPAISPLAIPIRLQGTLRKFLARYPHHTQLQISALARWRKNADGETAFFIPKGGGWGMKAAFHGSDPWAYPQFPLPAGIHAKRVVAVLLRARVAKSAMVRLMVFNQGGVPGYCTLSSPIIAANGKWHTVLIPLSRLSPMGKGPAHLTNLAGAEFISVGLNNGNAKGDNQLEVSKLYLLYRR